MIVLVPKPVGQKSKNNDTKTVPVYTKVLHSPTDAIFINLRKL
jgi:hypothetical protein